MHWPSYAMFAEKKLATQTCILNKCAQPPPPRFSRISHHIKSEQEQSKWTSSWRWVLCFSLPASEAHNITLFSSLFFLSFWKPPKYRHTWKTELNNSSSSTQINPNSRAGAGSNQPQTPFWLMLVSKSETPFWLMLRWSVSGLNEWPFSKAAFLQWSQPWWMGTPKIIPKSSFKKPIMFFVKATLA